VGNGLSLSAARGGSSAGAAIGWTDAGAEATSHVVNQQMPKPIIQEWGASLLSINTSTTWVCGFAWSDKDF
jgi:hypothetical protein